MHLPAGSTGGITAALSALAGSGVSEVAITELEIGQAGSNDYVTVVKACLAISACVSITVSLFLIQALHHPLGPKKAPVSAFYRSQRVNLTNSISSLFFL
jgi:hypothetical protein